MRFIWLFLAIVFTLDGNAQIRPEFEKEEAKDMIAICNSFPFLELYHNDSLILPKGYLKLYTSPLLGMDNMFQVYRKGNTAVINIRGSTAKKISWLENIYSAMIPAKGRMVVNGKAMRYNFARSPSAAVHTGYALALMMMEGDIVDQINKLNSEEVHDFIITGHSQGGALANLLRAYLENLPLKKFLLKNFYKTYAFAAPMVGNKFFADEYLKRYASNSTSFNMVNPTDPIPKLPLSYNVYNNISDNLKYFLNDGSYRLKDAVSDGLINLLEGGITKSISKFSGSVKEEIAKEIGKIQVPAYCHDINYKPIQKIVEVVPVSYPRVLRDSSMVQDEYYKPFLKKDNQGEYVRKSMYQKEPWSYQHKPYNYYVSILCMYFPEEYTLLQKKYLPENLR